MERGGGQVVVSPLLSCRARARLSAASRTAPMRDDGDPRGRTQALLAELLGEVPAPRGQAWDVYAAAGATTTAKDLIAERLALPEQAVVLRLRPWLSPETAAAWSAPGEHSEDAPRGYFAASQTEWRAVARRLVRCGLGRLLPEDSCPPGLAAGAFAVAKDVSTDRLIGDRRPMNAGEQQPARVRLPYAPRLRRLRLRPGEALWVAKRDLSNCFYQFEVEPDRLSRQVVGPRLPRSWFEHLEDESRDRELGGDRWHAADLGAVGPGAGEALGDGFCQLALAGVMMGDLGAVAVIQEAHTRMLLRAGVLSPAELLQAPWPFPEGPSAGDVYVDDPVLLMVGSVCAPPRS